jgi:hypothetical protein
LHFGTTLGFVLWRPVGFRQFLDLLFERTDSVLFEFEKRFQFANALFELSHLSTHNAVASGLARDAETD